MVAATTEFYTYGHTRSLHYALPIWGQEQGVGERQLVAAPAGMELDTGRTQHRRQFAGYGAQRYLQLRQVGLAQARHRLADLGQLVVPGIELAVAHALLEQAVALLQGAGVTAPPRPEVRFHVEQPPVDVAPPRLAAAADQGMAAGLEADRRQCGAQVAQTGDRLPAPTSYPGLSRLSQAPLAPRPPPRLPTPPP